jgi:hypothetical protein
MWVNRRPLGLMGNGHAWMQLTAPRRVRKRWVVRRLHARQIADHRPARAGGVGTGHC